MPEANPKAKKTAPTQVKIVMVEDHAMLRRSLAGVIAGEPNWVVCADVGSAAEAVEQVRVHQPDLLITDLHLPGMNGLELVKQLKGLYPRLLILVVSMQDELVYAPRVLKAGAKGFVHKDNPPDVLLQAIRQVLSGKVYISPAAAADVLAQLTGGGSAAQQDSPVNLLSDRELEIFEMIGRGMTSAQVGKQLALSSKTVDTHRENVKRKLGLGNSAQLFHHAAQWMAKRGFQSEV